MSRMHSMPTQAGPGATFDKGGVHPPGHKDLTAGLAIERMPLPETLAVNMAQHFGVPATPVVKAGQAVVQGQLIGVVEKGLGLPVHSPATGKVAKVTSVLDPFRGKAPCVVIAPDPEAPDPFEVPEAARPVPWETWSRRQILARICEAGVAGMGGAGFPSHIKLSPPPDLAVDTFLVNGAECEGYLSADHRLMLERPEGVVSGARMAMAALGVARGIIAVEANKADAITALRRTLDRLGPGHGLTVLALKVRYPQGSEKQLIQAALGRKVPGGGLPAHVGCVVQNAGTTYAIHEAVALGRNCIERVVTVSGLGIARPANLMCRIGTRARDMAEFLGGVSKDTVKFLLGGPMMGIALSSLDYSVTKTTSGLLFLTPEECDLSDFGPCIRCGRCLTACPMGLLPNEISIRAERGRFDGLERCGLLDCFECGSCAYVCPAKRPLVQFIRAAKAALRSRG